MKSTIAEISDQVKNLGVALHHNWLQEEDLNKTKKIVKKVNCLKGDYKGIFEPSMKFLLLDSFLKLRFAKMRHLYYFFNLAKKLRLKEIANTIFDSDTRLDRVDCYTAPINNKPVLDWHTDHSYGGQKKVPEKFVNPEEQTIKFLFFLSDVFSNNGCHSYIPKSHIIAVALQRGFYDRKLEYAPYWSLEDFRKTILIDENYNYLKKSIDAKILTNFLDETEPSSFPTFKYDYQPIKAGGAIIFNDSGLHRGSKTLVSERLVLRFFFVKTV